jgi:hypothetical protein
MNTLGKLDTLSTLSLAVASAVLVAGWIATAPALPAAKAQGLARVGAVTLTADGRMKMNVTAEPLQVRTASSPRVRSV